MPEVSIVMAVHKGMPYLAEALESILKQSWQDIEFLVIDDASSDGSLTILEQIDDVRLRLIKNKRRQGLAKSLNIGIAASDGKFIARMDADDVSMPKRIEKQYAFMLKNPDIDICGTWAKTIGEPPHQLWQYPAADVQIKAELIFASVLVHSSVMMRKASIIKHDIRYDENLAAAQDYELWARLMDNVSFANIGEVLLDYRLHPRQVGRTSGGEQQEVADDVRAGLIEKLGLAADKKEIALHHAIARWHFGHSLKELGAIESWLIKLLKANHKKNIFNQKAFEKVVGHRWWLACKAHVGEGLSAWRVYRQSDLRLLGKRRMKEWGSFFIKSAARELGFRR